MRDNKVKMTDFQALRKSYLNRSHHAEENDVEKIQVKPALFLVVLVWNLPIL